MKPGDRTLLLAGSAAAVSLVFAAAGLTISLIAAASPPVADPSSMGADSSVAAVVQWLWAVVLFHMLFPWWALRQVMLRRPRWTMADSRPFWASERVPATGLLIATCLLLVPPLFALGVGVHSLLRVSARSVTDSWQLAGLVTPLCVVSFGLALVSFVLFHKWWQAHGEPLSLVEPMGPANARALGRFLGRLWRGTPRLTPSGLPPADGSERDDLR